MSDSPDESLWLGRGTWLVDRRHYRATIGVVTDVNEREQEMGARLSIRWRPNTYQNCSVSVALENFKRGVWEVDNAS